MAEDFTAHGATYDVVFDAVGKTSFTRCKPPVRPRGLFLATDFGPFPWNPLLSLTTRSGGGRRVPFPLPKDNLQVVMYLRDRIEAGEFRPVIDRTFALDDIVEAYRYVDTEQKVGDVVIASPTEILNPPGDGYQRQEEVGPLGSLSRPNVYRLRNRSLVASRFHPVDSGSAASTWWTTVRKADRQLNPAPRTCRRPSRAPGSEVGVCATSLAWRGSQTTCSRGSVSGRTRASS